MIEEIERYNVLAGEIRKLGERLAPRCEVQGPFEFDWAAMAYIVDGERVTPEFIKIISRENQLTNHAFSRCLASRLSALEEQTGELRESFKQFYDRWTMDKIAAASHISLRTSGLAKPKRRLERKVRKKK